jgi:hypothetical protein
MQAATHQSFKSLKMLNNTIIEIALAERIVETESEVEAMYVELDAFVNGRTLKRLLIVSDKSNASRQARMRIVKENTKRKAIVLAEAIVVNSFATKLASNFYMFFQDHIYPMRFFNKRQEALKWLNKF